MALQVTRISVDNFKSLEGFELNLAKFVCLVGLNGTGKSTVLQCFDFLSRQCQGDIEGWLTSRNWTASDLNSRLTHKSNIDFEVDLTLDAGPVMHWEASFNRKELRCTRESITMNGQQILRVEDGQLMVTSESSTADSTIRRIDFLYQGSVLSQLKDAQLPPILKDFKYFFRKNIQALDMLTPALLRQRTRHAKGGLGMGGESLSAYLYEIGPGERKIVTSKLKEAYPHLDGVNVVSMKSGWKKLQITERYTGRALSTEARHVSDGLLRMLAVFSQLNRPSSFILLDEIENGINPELIEFLLDSLIQSRHQVMVTTHSPVILNYSDDVPGTGPDHWWNKHESMLNGFKREDYLYGVPMIPKPVSEAWILCALRQHYQHCESLKLESGRSGAKNPLKIQLHTHLGQNPTRELLVQLVEDGSLNMKRINMPSMKAFKTRCDEVMDILGWQAARDCNTRC